MKETSLDFCGTQILQIRAELKYLHLLQFEVPLLICCKNDFNEIHLNSTECCCFGKNVSKNCIDS